MNYITLFAVASIAAIFSADLAVSESASRITDVLSAAEKQRWMSALENVREEVAKHEREVAQAKLEVAKDKVEKTQSARRNLTDIIGGVFGRLADVQKQYEQAQLLLVGFSYNDCSGPSDPVDLRSFSVSPDPIPLPGRIVVSASSEVTKSIAGNLKASVKMETEIFGHFFEIPCVDNIGSCDYDDLCSLLPKPEQPCPPLFVKAGIPCRCPFPAGKFHLPSSAVMLPSVPLPIHSATVRLTVHLTSDGNPVTCIQITAQVEKKD